MISPGNERPSHEESKTGFKKLISRVKTALKTTGTDSSKRKSFLTSKSSIGSTTGGSANPPTDPTTYPLPSTIQPIRIKRSQIDAERARRLAARFDIPISSYEWHTPYLTSSSCTSTSASASLDYEAYRIERPIRMRIHRICHICSTSFGGNKICWNCLHPRCDKCAAYPGRKEGRGRNRGVLSGLAGVVEPDDVQSLRVQMELIRPGCRGGVGQQMLVKKRPVQRVRRRCCSCGAVYVLGGKICAGCGHGRCTECPRDPAKRSSHTNVYPGDAPSSSSTHPYPLTYICHFCSHPFPSIPHPSSADFVPDPPPWRCVRCGHDKCGECAWVVGRREVERHGEVERQGDGEKGREKEADEEVLRSLEERLKGIVRSGSGKKEQGEGANLEGEDGKLEGSNGNEEEEGGGKKPERAENVEGEKVADEKLEGKEIDGAG